MAWWIPVAAAAVAAGGSLLGDRGRRKHETSMMETQIRENRHVLQNQLQWRVDDAKKAGISPLAGLGMSPSGSPAITTGSAGGGAGDAISRGVSTYMAARTMQASAAKDEAIATYYRAEAAKTQQESVARQDATPAVEVVPAQVEVGQQRTRSGGQGGQALMSNTGVPVLRRSTEMGGQSAEDAVGETPGMFENVVSYLKGFRRGRQLLNEANRNFPKRADTHGLSRYQRRNLNSRSARERIRANRAHNTRMENLRRKFIRSQINRWNKGQIPSRR